MLCKYKQSKESQPTLPVLLKCYQKVQMLDLDAAVDELIGRDQRIAIQEYDSVKDRLGF
mgnify:CR=1 FL=1